MKRKTYCYLIMILLLMPGIKLHGQSENWLWVKTFGGNKMDGINDVSADKSGNTYVAGYFQSKIEIGTIKLISKGDTDALVFKLDQNGNVCWAKQLGGDFCEKGFITEYASKIKIDYEGNVIVAGIFAWNAIIDNFELSGQGYNDIFIVKYTSSGELIWAKDIGSYAHDNFCDIDIDKDNNILVSGVSNGPLNINNALEDSLKNTGSGTFLLKFSPECNLLWSYQLVGPADKTFVKCCSDNSVFWGVNYSSELRDGSSIIKPHGSSDFIIRQFNPSGHTVWSKTYASDNLDLLSSLSVSRDNKLLLSGKFANMPELKDNNVNDSINDNRTYFTSLTPDGSISWTLQNSGPSFLDGTKIIESYYGNYFCSDVFTDEINVGNKKISPKENWFNSYVAFNDKNNKNTDIIFSFPGIVSSISRSTDSTIVIAGNYNSGISTFKDQYSGDHQMDIFVLTLKSPEFDGIYKPQIIDISDGDFKIVPNPVSGLSCILSSETIQNPVIINITDANGNSVRKIDDCILPYELHIETLPSGIYYISLVKTGKVITKKMVVL